MQYKKYFVVECDRETENITQSAVDIVQILSRDPHLHMREYINVVVGVTWTDVEEKYSYCNDALAMAVNVFNRQSGTVQIAGHLILAGLTNTLVNFYPEGKQALGVRDTQSTVTILSHNPRTHSLFLPRATNGWWWKNHTSITKVLSLLPAPTSGTASTARFSSRVPPPLLDTNGAVYTVSDHGTPRIS